MILTEVEIQIPETERRDGLIGYLAKGVAQRIPSGSTPVRFAVTRSLEGSYECEVGVLEESAVAGSARPASIFEFVPRSTESSEAFNIVLLVPTGIGAEVGGHAGDAAPVARVLAEVADTLITHPNVVNASDINELPENGLYVEGSVLTRLLMGTASLQPVRSNRILVVIDAHRDELFRNAAINAVNAARAAYGLRCSEVVMLDPPVRLYARYSSSGAAAGRIEQLDGLWRLLQDHWGSFDAVALSSVIDVPYQYHSDYFERGGEMVNPWGGVEAMLTHTLSSIFDVPSAHSPMFESQEIANADPGIVEPRMAAEAVSLTFLQCVLKGLHRSPRIITERRTMSQRGAITASEVSCIIIPDGCLGLPTLAALEQGIPVIAVRENKNLMQNDLSTLPWDSDRFFIVENYWEAAGVASALKAGIDPRVVRRPIKCVSLRSAGNAEQSNLLMQSGSAEAGSLLRYRASQRSKE